MLRLSLAVHKTLLCLTGRPIFFFVNYSFLSLSLSLLQSCLLFASLILHVILSQPSVLMWWYKEDLVCHCKDGQMIESYEGRVSLSLEDLHSGNVFDSQRCREITERPLFVKSSMNIKHYKILFFSVSAVSIKINMFQRYLT